MALPNLLLHRSRLLIAGATCGLAGYLYITNPYVALILRGVFQFFVSGVSLWKGVLFLGFLGTLCFVKALWHSARTLVPSRYILYALISSGFIGLLLHLQYSSTYELDITSSTVAYHNGFSSSNKITHLHVTKGMIAVLLDTFGITLPIKGDSGVPYAHLLNAKLLYLSLLVSVVAVVLTIIGCLQFPGTTKAHFNRYWLLYATASFMCLKSIFDGGIFSAENLAGFAILASLTTFPKQFLSYLPSLSLVMAIATTLFALATPHTMLLDLIRDVLKCGSFLLLITLLSSGTFKIRRVGTILLLVGSLMIVSTRGFWLSEFRLMFKRIPHEVIVTEIGSSQSKGIVRFKTGKTTVSTIPTVHSPRTIDIHRLLGVSTGYRFANIDGVSCSSDKSFEVKGEVLVLRGAFESTIPIDQKDTFASFSAQSCEHKKGCTFSYTGEIRGCVANDASTTEIDFLNSRGLSTFILTSIRSGDSGGCG